MKEEHYRSRHVGQAYLAACKRQRARCRVAGMGSFDAATAGAHICVAARSKAVKPGSAAGQGSHAFCLQPCLHAVDELRDEATAEAAEDGNAGARKALAILDGSRREP